MGKMPKKKEVNSIISQATAEGKKPFDKAKWRREKYGHREKVDKWKNRKDEKVKRHYFKMLKREESKKVAAGAMGNSNLEPLGEKGKAKKEDPVTAKKMAAAFEARRKEAERKQMKAEKAARFRELEERRKEAAIAKKKRNSLMTRKTRKGQPLMGARMEMML